MPANDDLSRLLREWPYDPDDYLREVVGPDGRPKLQVRFPMGVEQYELDGRPDGLRPMGVKSYLDYYLGLRDKGPDGKPDAEFSLSPEDCDLLREEAMIYSYRYDLLYQRKDYERVARDAARNLAAFDLIARCASSPEDAETVEPHRPFALRLYFSSRALLAVDRRQYDRALKVIARGIRAIEELPPEDDAKWRHECKSALSRLRTLQRRIRRSKPLSPRQRLQVQLKKAVDREDYEVAAKLRDRIAAMPESEEPATPSA